MKRLLIVGPNSYIGRQFRQYLDRFYGEYQTDTLSVRTKAWRSADFSIYDCLLYAAGITHIKETAENVHLYYEVNRDLALAVAQKAKDDGVRMFIYLSSASVYGMTKGVITKDTLTAPITHYGKSKLQAEEGLRRMHCGRFCVVIVRSPMVYGPDCPGNYRLLVKLAEALPFFVDYPNRRSVIFIDNMSQFLKEMVDNGAGGIYFPQDPKYGCTCQMIQALAQAHGKRLPLFRCLAPLASLLKYTPKGRKAFGDLVYVGADPTVELFS